MKNIPLPTTSAFKKRLIEKVEQVIKRMRWRALFFLQREDDKDDNDDDGGAEEREEKFGFKTRKCPPKIEELQEFEEDLLKMIETIQFRNTRDEFQEKLKKDIKSITESKNLFVPADKTRNMYQVEREQYLKLLQDNASKHYKSAPDGMYEDTNKKAKSLAEQFKIDDRVEVLAKSEAYLKLKDHKSNFEQAVPCRLINPAKSEIGRISKAILDRVLSDIRKATTVNQWRSTDAVIEWFSGLKDKANLSFITFDIVEFYPSISEEILGRALSYARKYSDITEIEKEAIMNARHSLMFTDNKAWTKTTGNSNFDVAMGSYDGAEICELVGLLLLAKVTKIHAKEDIGLYRDDGLAVIRDTNGPKTDRMRKDIIAAFKEVGLKITIEANLRRVNFLDITLNLETGKYQPYRKPNDQPRYVHRQSNHPPTILKNIPDAIAQRLSKISSDQQIFTKAAPQYQQALKDSGYSEKIEYQEPRPKRNPKRKRKITWFNPPFSKTVKTDIGKRFLKMIDRHFPKKSKLHRIFNRSTVKVSYSTMPNMERIIKNHNAKISKQNKAEADGNAMQRKCNCRAKKECPLNGECLTESVVYQAEVKAKNSNETKKYIGLTEGPFKQRYYGHTSSFRHEKQEKSTGLSKYVWRKKRSGEEYTITWSTLRRAVAYSNTTKRCDLCLTEKLMISNADKECSLNKRSELVSKCRHENKYILQNYCPDNG